MFNKDDPAAVEWMKVVEAIAAEIWLKLSERRKGAAR